jgi:methionine synthase I (cobalamin-dependent)
MHALIQRLLSEAPVITDGAWGTELQKQGLEPGNSADLWNLEHPERVEAVAESYVAAGSRVILTNTFQANRIALGRHSLAAQVREINLAGVEISSRAARMEAYVFASMGPTGRMLAAGETSEAELAEVFAEQAEALAQTGPDAFVIETMSDPVEAKCAVAAARASGLPVVACMAFDSGRSRTQTMMGTTTQQAATMLAAAGADVIGANCGQSIEGYLEIYRGLASATKRPIWLKPNAGSPQLEGSRTVYATSPEAFAASTASLVKAGVAFIGGCCGTTSAFIAALRSTLHSASGVMSCA